MCYFIAYSKFLETFKKKKKRKEKRLSITTIAGWLLIKLIKTIEV